MEFNNEGPVRKVQEYTGMTELCLSSRQCLMVQNSDSDIKNGSLLTFALLAFTSLLFVSLFLVLFFPQISPFCIYVFKS